MNEERIVNYIKMALQLMLMHEGVTFEKSEAELLGEMDDAWWQMSDEEHEEAERRIKQKPAGAPKSLNLETVAVEIGDTHMPRKLIAADGTKVMDLGTALEIVLEGAKEHRRCWMEGINVTRVGKAQSPADMEEAFRVVEDFIVNQCGED